MFIAAQSAEEDHATASEQQVERQPRESESAPTSYHSESSNEGTLASDAKLAELRNKLLKDQK